ncbi:hypothetical protein [Marinobacter sp. NP-4(2019)]|uniref:hypothetical protein n=1 Tax=Marinobacter sp. NP-4(2019) TaxID=2488665 RepID=UPI0019811E66|nr:hypothetical protein [Marinobacter sp. NP-4(2019)]
MIEMPSFEQDHWELGSAEESHAKAPDTFWIPELAARKSLKRGDAEKLLFQIEFLDEGGAPFIQVERMWVIVSEVIGDSYIGTLDSKPATVEPEDDVYLVFGAEIPFKAEHIADIGAPPEDYVEWQLGQPPERVWNR